MKAGAPALFGLALSALSFEARSAPNEIVRISDGKIISAGALLDELAKRRLIVIGERHGVLEHQQREAFILAGLADRGRYPAVAFEMLTPTQERLVARYRAEQPEYALGLGFALEWWKGAWPSWAFYAPVFQVAFSAKLPIRGAELEGAGQDGAPPADILKSWVSSLDRSHCGLAPADRLDSLARTQWRRDLAMSTALKAADAGDGAVLIAGLAHARRDRSVPRHLLQEDVAIVALLPENGDGAAEKTGPNRSPYDYVWTTARTEKPTC